MPECLGGIKKRGRSMNTYVIGDVHGHHDALMQLVDMLPSGAKLVFVGDLIDRGNQSKEVIAFIREKGHLCVLGNHEKMMIEEAHYVFESYQRGFLCTNDPVALWHKSGGADTLKSYGLIKELGVNDLEILTDPYPDKELMQFRDDLEWVKSLPLYIELDIIHSSTKPVIVSHAAIADVWHKREEIDLEDFALWNRDFVFPYTPIFNIFGHTPKNSVDVRENDCVNVDTGCYLNKAGFGRLSAYCIETGEIFTAQRITNEKEN